MSEPLDRPAWAALTGRQAHLAVAQPSAAVRIDPAYGPFAAARDHGEEALAALASTLSGADDRIGIVEHEKWPLPPGTREAGSAELVQMVVDGPLPAATTTIGTDPRIVRLGEADATDMAALARAAEPGPWGPATHRFGAYYGIRIDGQLAAMAGERMLLPGLAELSGVATAPGFRGLGLAAALAARVLAGFAARGDRPFCHCVAENTGAIRLYERLGLRVRAPMRFTMLALA